MCQTKTGRKDVSRIFRIKQMLSCAEDQAHLLCMILNHLKQKNAHVTANQQTAGRETNALVYLKHAVMIKSFKYEKLWCEAKRNCMHASVKRTERERFCCCGKPAFRNMQKITCTHSHYNRSDLRVTLKLYTLNAAIFSTVRG